MQDIVLVLWVLAQALLTKLEAPIDIDLKVSKQCACNKIGY